MWNTIYFVVIKEIQHISAKLYSLISLCELMQPKSLLKKKMKKKKHCWNPFPLIFMSFRLRYNFFFFLNLPHFLITHNSSVVCCYKNCVIYCNFSIVLIFFFFLRNKIVKHIHLITFSHQIQTHYLTQSTIIKGPKYSIICIIIIIIIIIIITTTL